MTTATAPSIVAEALTKAYGAHVAVDGVDLTVAEGETLGILGPNGAGKTTLLKLLAGVTAPSGGRVVTRGRVVPLISVGVGFHAELSGRENVVVNGMLLGLTRAELAAAYDSIVAFAELAGHMDEPVKFFSTGMQLRLAFSVAMHARPDVLLLDEILAVGDTAFQLKCLDRMTELQQRGTTIVFVSHSVHAIRLLCPRAVVVSDGRVAFAGPSDAAVGAYHRLLSAREPSAPRTGAAVTIVSTRVLDDAGERPDELVLGRRYRARHRLRADRPVARPSALLVVTSEAGVEAHRAVLPVGERDLAAGDEVDLDIAFDARMVGGTYRLALTILDGDGHAVGDDGEGVAVYRPPALGSYGLSDLEATISIDGTVINDHGAVEIGARR